MFPGVNGWDVQGENTGLNTSQEILEMNTTGAKRSPGSGRWGSPIYSTTVVNVTAEVNNTNSETGYFWQDGDVFHIGTHEGNANANGPFIYTGALMDFYMGKAIDTTGSWFTYSDVEAGYNPAESFAMESAAAGKHKRSS